MSVIKTLLRRSIDYAGLFPPAKLDMREALRAFHSYQSHPCADFLSRFVIPVDRLQEAAAEGAGLLEDPKTPWRFSGLIRVAGAGWDDAKQAVETGAAALEDFGKAFPQAVIDVIETDLPLNAGSPAQGLSTLRNWAAFVQERFAQSGERARKLFFELDWRQDLEPLMEALGGRPNVGVKLRAGGTTPQSVPPSDCVARFLRSAADAGLPMKATAGLHVPVPNDNPEAGTRMHGFLNLFVAAFLAYSGRGGDRDMADILENAGYEDFRFGGATLQCRGFTFSEEEIGELRSCGMVSFGSCSFLEPIEHLQAHGLL